MISSDHHALFWWRARLGALLLALLAVVTLSGCRHEPAATNFQSFDFVQMCDPQLGFTDYAADLSRFEQAINQVNALHPDLVLICGDLVNGAKAQAFADFNAAKAHFAVPCYVAAGNHDVGNKPDAESLKRYRSFVGKDYFAVRHKGCLFVVVNSQLWKSPVAGETEKQDAWLAQTFDDGARKGLRIFLVMHYPLFVKEADEPEGYFNLPLEKRKELFRLLERYGVEAVLAGHTHTTTMNDYHGIQMVTSENTSRNFDKHPSGFRIWHITRQRPYQTQFVPLSRQ